MSWLDIQWPASTLKHVTLIDTPGLASINDENSRRTRDFLAHDETNPTDADAVIYLMRHLHRSDVEFLDAFMDRSVTAASPVNAVAVLSRADEIGAGRLDAMDSARRIAERYRNDPAVHRLAATVLPMAGLLAETGLTLLESEAAALRTLAVDAGRRARAHAARRRAASLDVHASDLTVEVRRHLSIGSACSACASPCARCRAGRATAAQLGPQLVEISGLGELRRVIAQHFLPRARVLQARSALAAVRALAVELRTVARPDRPTRSTARPSASRRAPSSSARSGPPTSWPAASGAGERRRAARAADAAARRRAAAGARARRRRGRRSGSSPPPCTRSRGGATGPPTRWPTRGSSRSPRRRPAPASRCTPRRRPDGGRSAPKPSAR